MGNLRGNKETDRRKPTNTLENSRRVSVVAILALVTLFAGVISILLNFSLSGDDEINPSTAHSAKKSSVEDQEVALRFSMGKTEDSQIKTATRPRGGNLESTSDEKKIGQPGQKSAVAQSHDQPETQPYGEPGDQPGIQTESIPNDELEDEIDDDIADEMEL